MLRNETVEAIVGALKKDKVVLMPSDTVPGLLARFSTAGLEALRRIKTRPEENPFLVLIPNKATLDSIVASVDLAEKKLIKDHWPGPLTVVFDKHPSVDNALTANKDTIAVRCPKFEPLNLILDALNEPLFSTSANISGDPTPGTWSDVAPQIKSAVDLVIEVPEPEQRVSSTIVRCENDTMTVLRQGIIQV